MKRAVCCKMAVAYQNAEVGGEGNVVYKVGPKGGQQLCLDEGSPKPSYKANGAHNQNNPPVWNMLARPIGLRRPQSPDSNACSDLPMSSTPSSNSLSNSLSTRLSSPSTIASSDGERRPSPSYRAVSSTPSRFYSGRCSTPLEVGVGQEKRSSFGSSPDSEKEKSSAPHFEEQYGARVAESHGAHRPSSRLFGRQPPVGMDRSELSSSSSSIGECDDSSDFSGEESNEVSSAGDMEVESSRRGPLHDLGSLKDSLPIKRGLSRYWNGKAKSFSCLADVSSIEELAKPEKPISFAKRRRTTTFGERHKSFPPLSRTSTAGISKRVPSNSGSRGGLATVVAMGDKLAQAPTTQQLAPSTTTASVDSTRSTPLTDLTQVQAKLQHILVNLFLSFSSPYSLGEELNSVTSEWVERT